MKDIKTLRQEIENIDTLPTIPTVLQRLLRVLENPNISLNEISNCILSDPVLTSRVLKLVNSPIYGFPGRISSLTQALILLGLNVVRGMLLGVSVFEAMEKTMTGLWKHSLGCAVTARIISKKIGVPEPEEISVAALLHDIGKVVMHLKYPDDYAIVLKQTEESGKYIFEVEKDIFNITHADAGAWIAQHWNFPTHLVEVIGYHHKPHLSRNMQIQTSVVHFSDILVRAKGFGFAGDSFIPQVNPVAWKALDFSDYDLKELLKELDDSLNMAEDSLLDD